MKQIVGTLLLITFLGSCGKKTPLEKVFISFSKSHSQVEADGTSEIKLSVTLSENASTDRRGVVFSTNKGVFTGSGGGKYISTPKFENGVLVAKAILKASTTPGVAVISFRPEFDSPIQEYTKKDSITFIPSLAQTIKLEPSSFGIASNFLSEVVIFGYLKNANGNFVSSGTKVLLEDSLLSNVKANGRFRNEQIETKDSSRISAVYSSSAYPIGTIIKIRATVLNSDSLKTNKSDFILLTINH